MFSFRFLTLTLRDPLSLMLRMSLKTNSVSFPEIMIWRVHFKLMDIFGPQDYKDWFINKDCHLHLPIQVRVINSAVSISLKYLSHYVWFINSSFYWLVCSFLSGDRLVQDVVPNPLEVISVGQTLKRTYFANPIPNQIPEVQKHAKLSPGSEQLHEIASQDISHGSNFSSHSFIQWGYYQM